MQQFFSLRGAGSRPRWAALLALLATAGAAQAQSLASAVNYTVGGTLPYFVTTGDLNGDGRLDLVTTNLNGSESAGPAGSVGVLLGQTGGTFAAGVAYPSGGTSTYGVAVTDVNNDGRADVVTANEYSNNVSVLLGTGTGTLGTATTYSTGTSTNPFGLAVGDINNDGLVDIVTANTYFTSSGNSTVGVLLGNGNGTFGAPTAYPLGTGNGARGVTLADLNKDSRLDIVVTDVNNGIRVLLRLAAGGFSPVATYSIGGAYPFFSAVSDINQDGNPDIVTAGGGAVSLLTGTGTGTFSAASNYTSVSANIAGFALGDVTGDGRPDALVANRDASTISVLVGTAAGTFGSMVSYPSGGSNDQSFSLTLGDFNQDGKADVAVANTQNSRVGVLLNTATYAAPTLTNINPATGPTGTSVVLTGTNLGSVTSITFNGVAATSYVVNSATTVTVTVPNGATTGNVVVTTGGGISNGLLFTVAFPDLTVSTTRPIPAGTYNSITVTGTGVGTLAGNVTVNSTLTVNSGGTLNDGCFTISGAGSFTLASGATLGICNAAGISSSGATGAVQVTGNRSFSTDATYVYNGTTAQNTGSGLPGQVRSLRTTNANTVTLSGACSVAQILTVGAAGNLATGGNPLILLSSASGTALVVNSGTGFVTGTATVQRYLDPSLNPGLGYRHYSSPVQSTSVSDLTTSGFLPVVNPDYNTQGNTITPFPTVYGYNEARIVGTSATTQAFEYGYFSPSTPGSTLTPGRGYTVNIPASEKVDLVGRLNTGTVAVGDLSRGSEANSGWQLLGNPYPAPLDWKIARINLPTGVLDAIYVYKSLGQYDGTYQFYQNGFGTLPNGLVPSMQGFFLRVAQPVALFNFLNAWRTTSYENPTFNRTTADTRPAVQLDLVSAQGTHEPTFVYFEAGATAGVDNHFDAEKLPNTTGLNLASVAAGTGLAVNGLPLPDAAATTVPLTVGVPVNGIYTLTAAALLNLSTTDVYLHDALTGQHINLAQQPSYSFSASNTALITGRFSLSFGARSPLSTRNALAASVSLYPNPAHKSFTLLVPAVSGVAQARLTLFNVLGQAVREAMVALPAAGAQATVDVQNLPAGVYVLRVQAGTTTIVKQVVVE